MQSTVTQPTVIQPTVMQPTVIQPITTWKKVTSSEELSNQIGLSPCLWEIVLIDDRCGRAQPTVGTTTPWQVVLSYIRKLAEQKPRSQPGIAFFHSSCFQVPAWFPAPPSITDSFWSGSVREIVFPHLVTFGLCVYWSNREPARTMEQAWRCLGRWIKLSSRREECLTLEGMSHLVWIL